MYSFRGNYSFFHLEIQRSQYIRQKVTVHTGAETIQGRKLFKGGNYMRNCGNRLTYLSESIWNIPQKIIFLFIIPFPHKLGWIGSAISQATPKWLPLSFSYLQHNFLLIKKKYPTNNICPHIFDTYYFSYRWCVPRQRRRWQGVYKPSHIQTA